MSDYKPEILPSGVLIRKIKDDDDRFVLSSEGQSIIVSKLDIARMDGIVYPTRRLSEKCGVVPKSEEPVNVEQAWHDVSQKLLKSELEKRVANNCITCTIQERDEQVKQITAHTCMIGSLTNNGADTNPYDSEVRRIAEILAKIEYDKHAPFQFVLWDNLDKQSDGFMGDGYYKDIKNLCIEDHIPMARAMMAEMNTVHYKGYVTGLSAKDQFPLDDEISVDSRSQYYVATLIKRGLIPSPENEQK